MHASADIDVPLRSGSRIVGCDPLLRAVFARVARVAPTRLSVLVRGESGTGKELIGRALHDLGRAPEAPFVAVNCGALPRELAESELFGHERGAFTGASTARAGWFEEAHGGTLVLDELGELPLDLQPKLLRVLETGRLRRVGGRGEIEVDVRVVALTNRHLRREADAGRFRLDLYHRIAAVELELPPLRQRKDDLPLLAKRFVDELAAELGPIELAPDALDALGAYDWPGNVRELRNVLRRAAVLAGPRLDAAAIEDELGSGRRLTTVAFPAPPRAADGEPPAREAGSPDALYLPGKTYLEIQRHVFTWALVQAGGSRRRAAQALGISRSTFCDRIKRLGIVPPSRATAASDACAVTPAAG